MKTRVLIVYILFTALILSICIMLSLFLEALDKSAFAW